IIKRLSWSSLIIIMSYLARALRIIEQTIKITTIKVAFEQGFSGHLPLEPPNIVQAHKQFGYGGFGLFLVGEEEGLQEKNVGFGHQVLLLEAPLVLPLYHVVSQRRQPSQYPPQRLPPVSGEDRIAGREPDTFQSALQRRPYAAREHRVEIVPGVDAHQLR
ncbi:hypothetical protein PanWU01x14_084680, partial [Parasponia andersonii]